MKAGILEWIGVGDKEKVSSIIEHLRNLGVKHFRTGVSWVDWYNGEKEWFEWLFNEFVKENVEVLPCLTFTPPEISEANSINSPPKRLEDYSEFVREFLDVFFEQFDYIELWNEHNFPSDWRYDLDPDAKKFSSMIKMASDVVHEFGKKVVLGGIERVDVVWLEKLSENKLFEHIDIFGFHSVENISESLSKFFGWTDMINVIRRYVYDKPVWITELSYSTFNSFDEIMQVEHFRWAIRAGFERVYWHSLFDMPKDKLSLREEMEGISDERQYHLGIVDSQNNEKLLYRIWSGRGIVGVGDFDISREENLGLENKASKDAPGRN